MPPLSSSQQGLAPAITHLDQARDNHHRPASSISHVSRSLPVVLERCRLGEQPHGETDRVVYNVRQVADALRLRVLGSRPRREDTGKGLGGFLGGAGLRGVVAAGAGEQFRAQVCGELTPAGECEASVYKHEMALLGVYGEGRG
jgi:hypothetical protein